MPPLFVVFGNMFTFAASKENMMLVSNYTTLVRGTEMMPSGSHICLVKIKSHSRYYC